MTADSPVKPISNSSIISGPGIHFAVDPAVAMARHTRSGDK